jgi:hypothetical protein
MAERFTGADEDVAPTSFLPNSFSGSEPIIGLDQFGVKGEPPFFSSIAPETVPPLFQ